MRFAKIIVVVGTLFSLACLLAEHGAELEQRSLPGNATTEFVDEAYVQSVHGGRSLRLKAANSSEFPTPSQGVNCAKRCYDHDYTDLWSAKCATKDCSACAICNFKKPNKADIRAVCPAFNVLANHGLINRDGRNIHRDIVASLAEEYFGVQKEVVLLIFGSFYGQALRNPALTFNPTNFSLDQLAQFDKNPSYINNNRPDSMGRKTIDYSKLAQLKKRANADGKITQYDLAAHYKKVIIQERCNGNWVNPNPLYEGSGTGPQLNFAGDALIMSTFANPDDFATKALGFNAPDVSAGQNPGISNVRHTHIDIDYLTSIFEENRFPDSYIRRDCSDPNQCLGQVFGRMLEPILPLWPPPLVALFDSLEKEPEFDLIVEYIQATIIEAVYRDLNDNDCGQKEPKRIPGDVNNNDREQKEPKQIPERIPVPVISWDAGLILVTGVAMGALVSQGISSVCRSTARQPEHSTNSSIPVQPVGNSLLS